MFNPVEALRDNPALFACYILFVYFRGKNAVRIEREMRALGYPTFHRRSLYPRGKQPGWIAKHNWQSQLKDEGGRLKDESRASGSSSSFIPQPSSFDSWLKRVSPNMTWDWKHQQVIIEQLKKVTDGSCKRLMIFLPPRHGKSELVSVRYTAWRMQKDPSMNVILGSYNQRLADRMSRKIRTVICDAESMDNGQRTMDNAGKKSGNVEQSVHSPLSTIHSPETVHSPLSTIHSPETVHSQLSTVNSSPFPFSRPRPKNAVSEWETATGGSFRAVGSGSGVTGFGADLIVIDDPVKNRAQAESETFRNRVWDWYKDDLYTRLEPNGSIVLIQTRWHEEDLAGRLLRDNLDDWTVINLPALAEAASAMDNGQRKMESEEPDAETRLTLSVPPAVAGGCTSPVETDDGEFDSTDLSQEGRFTPALDTEPSGGKPAFPTEIASEDRSVPPPETIHSPQSIIRSPEIVHSPLSTVHCFDWRQPGEALCPERFDIDALDRLKTQLGTYAFSALFQQRPTPAGGQIFKREWFKQIIDFAPPGLNWKRGYDLAVSTRTESDYTASFRVAFDDNTGNLYISGGFRRRIEFPDQRRYIIDRIIHERDTEHGVELALHGQALMQELRRDPALRGRSFRGVKVSTDKLTRANTWAPIAEEGKVILVRTSVPPAVAGGALPSAARHRDDLETADTEISPPVKHHPLHPVHPVKNSPQPTHTDWISDLLDELSAFPNGTHDDQIDAISIAVHMHATKPNRAVGMLIT